MAAQKEEKHVTIEDKHVTIADKQKTEDQEQAAPPAETFRKKILIAVDGSGASNHAVDWYLDEIHREGNFVIFLHSFELPLLHSYQEMYVAPEMWQAALKKEADRTTHMEKVLMKKLKMKEISGKFLARGGGKVGEVLLKEAEEDDVDLIVMGTRGHGKMMRALMGSVSHFVMSHAHCPVMVYRDKAKERARNAKKGKNNGDEDKDAAKKEA